MLDHPELLEATGGREIFFEHEDGRVVLIYPMLGRVLVGTTDLEHDMNEPAVCTDEEVQYFFDLIRHVFPTIKVNEQDIVYKFSGVRPLPNHDDTAPGFVSRDYQVKETRLTDQTTMLSLIGGKWTTFRALSENLGSKALEFLGERQVQSTAGVAIGGGKNFPMNDGALSAWYAARESKASHDRLRILFERYGTRADQVMVQLGDNEQLLENTNELSVQEIAYLAENEQVGRLIDVFIRRTNLAFRGLVTKDLVNEVAHYLADPMGWDQSQLQAEIDHSLSVLAERHGVILS